MCIRDRVSSNIEFNKKCLHLNLIPRYAVININNKSRAAQIAKSSAERIWIKKEIDHLYVKKIRLNSDLYRIHLELLNALHPAIYNSVLDKVEQQIQCISYKIFVTHNKKLCSLQHKQINTVDTAVSYTHLDVYKRQSLRNVEVINHCNLVTIHTMNSEAYPALLVYKYKNTKVKLIKASSNIEFNTICLHLNLIPR